MHLEFDAGSGGRGWAFRWRNPFAGDRVSTLQGLISDGRITISAPQPVHVFNCEEDGFTYIGYTTTPGANGIVGAYVYHKGSSFADSGIQESLDTGKQLAKETSEARTLGFENLINSSRGINGIVFDIEGLEEHLSTADFEFRVSPQGAFDTSNNPPSSWTLAPAPSSISTEICSPSRVTIEWADNAISDRYGFVSCVQIGW